MQLQGLVQLKNPPTPGIEPSTFWLVAYFLNQLLYRVPQKYAKYLDRNNLTKTKSTN
jgi:hypothetical protein